MLKLVIFVALLAVAIAASVDPSRLTANNEAKVNIKVRNLESSPQKEIVPIVRSVAERKSDGSFIFSYEGADGSAREEVGVVHNAGTDEEAMEISGSYRYIDADGQLVEVKYTAGKDGFIPVGTNILPEISAAANAAAEVARKGAVHEA